VLQISVVVLTDVLVEEDVDAVREIVRMVSEAGIQCGEEQTQRKLEYTHMMSSLPVTRGCI
jgi:hypothetical protein